MEKVILKLIPEKYLNHQVIPECNCSIRIEDITYVENILDSKGNILKDRCLVLLSVKADPIVVLISFEELEKIRDTYHINTNKFEIRGFQKE